MAAVGSLLYGDFGTSRHLDVQRHNLESGYRASNPENMAAVGSLLYGDFGTYRHLDVQRHNLESGKSK